jgi:protein-tyrosine phosphatase
MAQGLFRKYLAEKVGCSVDELDRIGYKVLSAGTMNIAGVPASAEAVTACALRGVDITGHVSQHLTRSLIDASDFVFCMSSSHCEQVSFLSPDAERKCSLLGRDREIPDPIGQPQAHFDNCAGIIEAAVKARISELTL